MVKNEIARKLPFRNRNPESGETSLSSIKSCMLLACKVNINIVSYGNMQARQKQGIIAHIVSNLSRYSGLPGYIDLATSEIGKRNENFGATSSCSYDW